MTPSIAYVEHQKNWYLLFGWNFGAKQEEMFSDEYQEKKATQKNSAKRYCIARDLISFRKKIKEKKIKILEIGGSVSFINGSEIRNGVILSVQERICTISSDDNNDRPYVVFKSSITKIKEGK